MGRVSLKNILSCLMLSIIFFGSFVLDLRAEEGPGSAWATGKPLPLGTVVSALPGGCTPTPVGAVEYYYCGGNFYRAVFQGNQLVYVTAKPE